MPFDRVFKEHPESVGETYREHLVAALGFAGTMARAALCCAVHAFLPFLFTKTGSRALEELRTRMNRGRPIEEAVAGRHPRAPASVRYS